MQLALKLTVNALYGCIGSKYFRYYDQGLASSITEKGREILRAAVSTVEQLGLEVVYGDTDSIMVDTKIKEGTSMEGVVLLSEEIRSTVNAAYKWVHLGQDKIFKTLLIVKKKKYASVSVDDIQDAKGVYKRDLCEASQKMIREVLDVILTNESEATIDIDSLVSRAVEEITRSPLEDLVITRELGKNLCDYRAAHAALPHVQVARAVNITSKGELVPFVMCVEKRENEGGKAYHPSEVVRSSLTPDYQWYIKHQLKSQVGDLIKQVTETSRELILTCVECGDLVDLSLGRETCTRCESVIYTPRVFDRLLETAKNITRDVSCQAMLVQLEKIMDSIGEDEIKKEFSSVVFPSTLYKDDVLFKRCFS